MFVLKKLMHMFYLVPPAGTPITLSDILHTIKTRISSDSLAEIFADKIKNHAKVKYCFFFNSGRTALASILYSLYILADNKKTEVVIPAYTCFSVAAAIAKSGLKIRLVDIDPLTMDYDYEKLEDLNSENVLAIIGCNLFGILSDWSNLVSIAKEKNVYLIDDAAQSMGTLFLAKASGTLGDVGFYSLGRGKNLSTVSGGILITDNEEIATEIEKNIKNLKTPGLIAEMNALLKIVLYSMFIKPSLYWVPNRLPLLGLGDTIFDETFSLGFLTNVQKRTGGIIFGKLGSYNSIRSHNARRLAEALLKTGHYLIPGYTASYCPAYLRLPLLTGDKSSRDAAILALKKLGIVASNMYPSSIYQISGIDRYLATTEGNFPGADNVVERLLTLPTHPLLKEKHLNEIINCLESYELTQ